MVTPIQHTGVRPFVRRSRSSFYLPMLLVPREKREAMMTVYAFCRYTDDIVDGDDHRLTLSEWKTEFALAVTGGSSNSFLNDVVRTAERFKIPIELFSELIRGMEMDEQSRRYTTFEELYDYCYKVASTVGLMIIRILGRYSEHTEAFAVNTGIALQLTNIVRDVSADIRLGRIYFPSAEMTGTLADPDERLRLLRQQCNRAEEYHARADRYYALDPSYALFPARAMQNIYRELLSEIKQNLHELPHRRIRLSGIRKANVIARTWFTELRYHGR